MSGTVELTVNGIAVDRTEYCSCADITPRGIGLECPGPIEVDSIVQLRSDGERSKRWARVRYCRESGALYRIGLEFMADMERAGDPGGPFG